MRRTRDDYENASLYIQDQLRSRRRRFRLIAGSILALLVGTLIFLLSFYRVQYVTVEIGRAHV